MKFCIVIYHDLLEKYFSSRNKFNKDSLEFDIQTVIEHPHNKIVITDKYLKELEKVFIPDSAYYNDFTCFITELLDNEPKCDSVTLVPENGFDSEFINIANNHSETTIALSYSKRSFSITNYAYFSSSTKNLKNTILISLLKERKYIARYTDFSDNNEILSFFKILYNIPKSIKYLTVFERYANVNHSLYDYIKDQGILFKYYMAKATSTDTYALKKKYVNIEIYSTNNKDLIHERTIIFDKFIVTMDDDPFVLDSKRETWSISVEYSSSQSSTLIKKCSKFTKTI